MRACRYSPVLRLAGARRASRRRARRDRAGASSSDSDSSPFGAGGRESGEGAAGGGGGCGQLRGSMGSTRATSTFKGVSWKRSHESSLGTASTALTDAGSAKTTIAVRGPAPRLCCCCRGKKTRETTPHRANQACTSLGVAPAGMGRTATLWASNSRSPPTGRRGGAPSCASRRVNQYRGVYDRPERQSPQDGITKTIAHVPLPPA